VVHERKSVEQYYILSGFNFIVFGGFMLLKIFGIALSVFFLGCSGCAHDPKPEPTPTPSPTPEQPPLPPAEITEGVTVNFDFASAHLGKNQKKVLGSTFKGKLDFPVKIVGHTDSQGSDKYNQKLSEKRAAVVAKYLKKTLKVKGNITVEGKGEKSLLNADKTKKEHAANRRAEIVIILN
jgi:OOP family OmpA-OmpF porin